MIESRRSNGLNKGFVILGALAVLLSACSQPQVKDDTQTLSQDLPSPPLEAVEPAAGLVTFALRVRCMRSCAPLCCGCPGGMRW